jgi:hypothetical protein
MHFSSLIFTLFVMLLPNYAVLQPIAATPPANDLRHRYPEIQEQISHSPFKEPIYLESAEANGVVRGELYARVDYSFQRLAGELQIPSVWCDILFLHFNVKACVPWKDRETPRLTLYIGEKHYQPPEEAERIDLNFRIITAQDDLLLIELYADRGPYRTRDYQIHVQAVPLTEEKLLLHAHYSINYGSLARFALRLYLALAGRHRIGFSVERLDRAGEPVYVRGLRGIMERNVMRLYLSLQAYLDTLPLPLDERFEARLQRWFTLTERYPRQLRELDEDTYLQQKRDEYAQQRALQHRNVLP